MDFATADDADRAVQLGNAGLRIDGHLLRIESGGGRADRARKPPAAAASKPPPAPAPASGPDDAQHAIRYERATNDRNRRTRSSRFPDPLRTDDEPRTVEPPGPRPPPSTVLGDRGQPLRVEHIRTAVRWDMVLEWEDVDMDTVARKPRREAEVFGNIAQQFAATGSPAAPAASPKVTAQGPVPAGYAPAASVRLTVVVPPPLRPAATHQLTTLTQPAPPAPV